MSTRNSSGPRIELVRETLARYSHLQILDMNTLRMKRRIGKGSFGEVWLADLDGRDVAVKRTDICNPAKSKSWNISIPKSFARELVVWAELDHWNVVKLEGFSFSEDPHLAWLVSTYFQCGHIGDFLSGPEGSQLPMEFVHDLALDTARGLEYLHTRPNPFYHADLKPENVLLQRSGKTFTACLCDFGLTKAVEGNTGLTRSDLHRGITWRYTSPELANAAENVNEHSLMSDVWSWGCLLASIMTKCGIAPWSWCPTQPAAYANLGKGWWPLTRDQIFELHPGIPPLLMWCWDSLPSRRPTMTECFYDLEESRSLANSRGVLDTDFRDHDQAILQFLKDEEEASDRYKVPHERREIYEAEWTEPDSACRVTVKVDGTIYFARPDALRTEPVVWHTRQMSDQVFINAFGRLTKLKHPNITTPIAYLSTYNELFLSSAIVIPRRPHGNITNYVEEHPSVDKLQLLMQATRGLCYLHSCVPQILHLNLKPSNILINDAGVAELTDFEVKSYDRDSNIQISGSGSSTGILTAAIDNEDYLAPDGPKGSTATDVFAMARVTLQVMSGRRPWPNITARTKRRLLYRDQPPIHREENTIEGPQCVVDELWKLMEEGWSVDATQRPTSDEFAIRINDIWKHLDVLNEANT